MSDVFAEMELAAQRDSKADTIAALRSQLAVAEAGVKTWENEAERRSRRYELAAVRLAEASKDREVFFADLVDTKSRLTDTLAALDAARVEIEQLTQANDALTDELLRGAL
jgi:chromosome segregation ATPase